MLHAVHPYASGTFTDTETTISAILDPGIRDRFQTVHARIRVLPGFQWWEEPPPRVIRRWVDAELKGTGFVRFGAREQVRGEFPGWRYRFAVRHVDSWPFLGGEAAINDTIARLHHQRCGHMFRGYYTGSPSEHGVLHRTCCDVHQG